MDNLLFDPRGISVRSIYLDQMGPHSTIFIKTTTDTYRVVIAKHPRTYIEGNRPVVKGVRVTQLMKVRELLEWLDPSREQMAPSLERALLETFPDRVSSDVRLGFEWQINDDPPTGPVQEILVQENGERLF